MPRMKYGSLWDLFSSEGGGPLPEDAIAHVIREILEGIYYLHT